MSGFLKKFKCSKKPVRVPTDEVVPLHHLDDNRVMRDYFLNVMLRFDAVLDTEKLRGSLETLLEREDWRKFGARLRLNKKGKLEYHIPAHFDREKRPAIGYSHVSYDMNIDQHPLASRIPKASTGPAIVADPYEFISLMRRPGGPKEIGNYLTSDEPQIGLHIVSFRDATLVSMCALHTLVDGMGAGIILRAWNLVLQGRDHEISKVAPEPLDPISDLATSSPKEEYKLADKRMTGFQMMQWWARWQLDIILHPKDGARIFCVPAAYLNNLRGRIMRELKAQGNGDEKAFVSEGDVLCAWVAKLCATQLPRNSQKTVCVGNAMGMRPAISSDLPANTVYIANAVLNVYALMTAQEMFEKPISWVAAQVRKSITELGTREQMQALLALGGNNFNSLKKIRLFGPPDLMLLTFSNWTKAGLFQADFSAAALAAADGTTSPVGPLRPSYVNEATGSRNMKIRNCFMIMGKDAAGNYWLSGRMRTGFWALMEEEMKRQSGAMAFQNGKAQ